MAPVFRPFYLISILALSATVSQGAETRWIRLRSANFEMYTSASPGSARDTIRQFEQVRGIFAKLFGGLPPKPLPIRLVIFGSAREFASYRPNDFAAAYYHETMDRDYIAISQGSARIRPTAVHEYVHLLVRHFELELPPWLNEGLAEVYSTIRPIGDQVVVGALIPGRHRALIEDTWIPLATILAADHNSPYYNEKAKVGGLYNEGWALTHMLYIRDEYRPKFAQILRSISGGKDSAAALLEVYGRPVEQIEKELRAYIRGSYFQGAVASAKLDQATGEIPVEALPDFDRELMSANLMYRPGKEAAYQTALERLIELDPKRPEPYRGLGYLALREKGREAAMQEFAKGLERGDADARFLWDYGRLLESDDAEAAVRVLSMLLSREAGRIDVRLEVAAMQLRADHAGAALTTLAPIRSVRPADSRRFFEIAVYAHLRNGEAAYAAETARHFLEVAKTDADRAAAEGLVRDASAAAAGPRPASGAENSKPAVRRLEGGEEPEERAEERPRVLVSGRFVALDCQGKQARMILETAVGQKALLIEDPNRVAITSGGRGQVEMACGPQKTPLQVEVELDPRPAGVAGVDGL